MRELLRDEFASDGAAHLQQLCEQELIVRRASSRFSSEVEYAFRHALVREGAYAMLTDPDRALGHALAGEWLLRTGEQDPMVLIEHFERGAARAKAATFYAKAAEQAMRGADFPTAISRAKKGLESEPDNETKVFLCGLLSITYFMTAQYAQSYEVATTALQMAERNTSSYARALGFSVASSLFLGRMDVFGNLVRTGAGMVGVAEAANARGKKFVSHKYRCDSDHRHGFRPGTQAFVFPAKLVDQDHRIFGI